MAKKRKKRGEPFVMLHYLILDSDEYRKLPRCARDLLTQFIRQHDGKNNGGIYAAQEAIMEWCAFGSPVTAIKAFRALVEIGLVVVTYSGSANLARRIGLRWLPPGTQIPSFLTVRTWEMWSPGMRFPWVPSPVRRRCDPKGRPGRPSQSESNSGIAEGVKHGTV